MNTTNLGDLADLRAGFGFPKLYQGRSTGDLPFAKVGDISRVGRSDSNVLITAGHFIDEADLKALKARAVPTGSTLFAKIGEAIRQEHRVMAGRPLVIDNNAMAAVPRPGVDPRYLFRFLQTLNMYSMTSSTTVPALRKSDLERVPAPLRDIGEQRRIVGILDKADELRTKRRQSLARLEDLTQSVFHDMFAADKVDTVEFSTVCRRITDGTHQSPEWSDKGIPFLFISNVSTGEISLNSKKFISELEWQRLTARCPVEVGDILYTTVGSYGIPAIVRTEEKFAFQRHIAHIKPKTDLLHPEFTKAMLASDSLVRQADEAAVGVAQKTLNLQAIKKFKVMVPPMKDQRDFARRTESVRRLKDWQQAQLAELDVLFASLQRRAFRGEL